MTLQLLLLVLSLFLSSPFSLSSPSYNITQGSSLSGEKNNDILISRNQVFSAGFHQVGENAYFFSIWYTKQNDTIVWMANRDKPVNGKRSKLTLTESGELVLKDAGEILFWPTGTTPTSSVHLQLNDTGNLVLQTLSGETVWQSFDFPTDTLLPQQFFTKQSVLVSSRSITNHSSGFYKVYFDDNNVLRIAFSGVEATSVYWPSPWQDIFQAGRTIYNNSKIAVLDSSGYFNSSDEWEFLAADYGMGPKRRLRIDSDGNFRLYSLDRKEKTNWKVQWQAIPNPCKIHGVCRINSLCNDKLGMTRRCSCIPGYKMKNQTD